MQSDSPSNTSPQPTPPVMSNDSAPTRSLSSMAKSSAGYAQVRSVLNGGKTITPLMQALLRHPGILAEEAGLQAAVAQITGLHRESVDRVMTMLMPSQAESGSARALVAPYLADVIGSAWTGEQVVSAERVAEFFVGVFAQMEEGGEVSFELVEPALDENLSTAAGVGQSMPTLLKIERLPAATQRLFIGDASVAELAEIIRNDIVSAVNRVLSALERIYAPLQPASRLISYKSILRNVSVVFAEALGVEHQSLSKELSKLDKDGRAAYLAALKTRDGGELMSRVRKSFVSTIPVLYPEVVSVAHNPAEVMR